MAPQSSLKQSTVLQVVLNDDIGDGVEDELDVVRVGGACEMRVDLLLIFSLVEILEFHSYVARCFLVCVGTWKTSELVIIVHSPREHEAHLYTLGSR